MLKKLFWKDGIDEITDEQLVNEIKQYAINASGKVFVGSDSMLRGATCKFACVIALYDKEAGIAKYFYKKFTTNSIEYKNLQKKILKEVDLSISIACFLTKNIPDIDIEVHVDIGNTNKNETKKYVNLIKGWVNSSGYKFKHKPESWASSSIADWHTK